MDIWLVSPAWRRYSVTRLALAERRWLCDELAKRGHQVQSVIVADDENLDIAREFGFDVVEKDNSDLGAKFNAGYRYAAERGAELFVHIGSDDWVHPKAFHILDTMDLNAPPPFGEREDFAIWKEGPVIVFQRKAAIANLETGRLMRCNVRGPYGVIPWLIPRKAMFPSRFQPIKLGKMRGIDGSLARALREARPNWLSQPSHHEWLVDFKSQTNITHYKLLEISIGASTDDDFSALRRFYPDELVDLAEATCSS